MGPLYDGESVEIDGVTYELTQMATNRGASTFDNVLTINQPLADIVDSSFSCSVTNSIGSSTASDTLPIMGKFNYGKILVLIISLLLEY